MIANLEIKNFTTFGKLKFSLSPRVNVIIGSNGTGKTHLLKAIYGLALAGQPSLTEQSDKKLAAAVSRKFLRIFSPDEERVGTLQTKGVKTSARLSLVSSNDSSVAISFKGRSKFLQVDVNAGGLGHEPQPVFIPTKEVLSLIRGVRHPDHDHGKHQGTPLFFDVI